MPSCLTGHFTAAGKVVEQAAGGGHGVGYACCSLLNPAALHGLDWLRQPGGLQGWQGQQAQQQQQQQRRLVAATAAAMATLDLGHYRAALQQCRRMARHVLAAKHVLSLPRAQRSEGAVLEAAAQLSALELAKGRDELLELCAELQYLACPAGGRAPALPARQCLPAGGGAADDAQRLTRGAAATAGAAPAGGGWPPNYAWL
jgi:hypothetical protein